MRKLVLLSFVIVASLQFCGAQSLDKMQWFNEPEQWEIKDKSLSNDPEAFRLRDARRANPAARGPRQCADAVTQKDRCRRQRKH